MVWLAITQPLQVYTPYLCPLSVSFFLFYGVKETQPIQSLGKVALYTQQTYV